MNNLHRRLRRVLKYFLCGIAAATLPMVVLIAFTSMLCEPEYQIQTWRYGRFLNALQAQTVEQVTLNQELSAAIIQTKNDQTVSVKLPDESEPYLEDLLIESSAEVLISENWLGRVCVVHPTTIIVAIMAYSLIVFIFWLWMLIDCAIQEAPQGNIKITWILIIIFTAWIGAFVYLLFRRPQRKRELGR